MRKVPTIFERDWNGDRSRVVDQINPEAQWVFDGEGWPTQKLDGTSCMVRDLRLYKRREIREEELANNPPADFEVADRDATTGKVVGWVPVGYGPEDRWHDDALQHHVGDLPDGTYELIGPKVQGNPEREGRHMLIAHTSRSLVIAHPFERTFGGIRDFLASVDMEGLVFHHPDGRMAKIKGRDFGLKRIGAAA